MVQIEGPSNPECREGVLSPGAQQVEEHRKKSQDQKLKSRVPGLVPVDLSLVLPLKFKVQLNSSPVIWPEPTI